MTIKLSDNSLLKKIFLDGVGLKQFSPTTFEYEYLLFAGNSIPEITVEKGDEKQEVYITMNPIGEFTYIFVEAEDKSVSEYKILFKNSTESTTTTVGRKCFWTPIGNGYILSKYAPKDKLRCHFPYQWTLNYIQDVPLVDLTMSSVTPERPECISISRRKRYYICVFYYEGKKIIRVRNFFIKIKN